MRRHRLLTLNKMEFVTFNGGKDLSILGTSYLRIHLHTHLQTYVRTYIRRKHQVTNISNISYYHRKRKVSVSERIKNFVDMCNFEVLLVARI